MVHPDGPARTCRGPCPRVWPLSFGRAGRRRARIAIRSPVVRKAARTEAPGRAERTASSVSMDVPPSSYADPDGCFRKSGELPARPCGFPGSPRARDRRLRTVRLRKDDPGPGPSRQGMDRFVGRVRGARPSDPGPFCRFRAFPEAGRPMEATGGPCQTCPGRKNGIPRWRVSGPKPHPPPCRSKPFFFYKAESRKSMEDSS